KPNGKRPRMTCQLRVISKKAAVITLPQFRRPPTSDRCFNSMATRGNGPQVRTPRTRAIMRGPGRWGNITANLCATSLSLEAPPVPRLGAMPVLHTAISIRPTPGGSFPVFDWQRTLHDPSAIPKCSLIRLIAKRLHRPIMLTFEDLTKTTCRKSWVLTEHEHGRGTERDSNRRTPLDPSVVQDFWHVLGRT